MKKSKFLFVLKILVFATAGVAAFGWIVTLLWNALLPMIFHLPVISFWQGIGLLILSKIFFGGFRGGGGGPWKRGRFNRWNDKMKENWMKMSPEEREKFSRDWKTRCGWEFKEEKPAQ